MTLIAADAESMMATGLSHDRGSVLLSLDLGGVLVVLEYDSWEAALAQVFLGLLSLGYAFFFDPAALTLIVFPLETTSTLDLWCMSGDQPGAEWEVSATPKHHLLGFTQVPEFGREDGTGLQLDNFVFPSDGPQRKNTPHRKITNTKSTAPPTNTAFKTANAYDVPTIDRLRSNRPTHSAGQIIMLGNFNPVFQLLGGLDAKSREVQELIREDDGHGATTSTLNGHQSPNVTLGADGQMGQVSRKAFGEWIKANIQEASRRRSGDYERAITQGPNQERGGILLAYRDDDIKNESAKGNGRRLEMSEKTPEMVSMISQSPIHEIEKLPHLQLLNDVHASTNASMVQVVSLSDESRDLLYEHVDRCLKGAERKKEPKRQDEGRSKDGADHCGPADFGSGVRLEGFSPPPSPIPIRPARGQDGQLVAGPNGHRPRPQTRASLRRSVISSLVTSSLPTTSGSPSWPVAHPYGGASNQSSMGPLKPMSAGERKAELVTKILQMFPEDRQHLLSSAAPSLMPSNGGPSGDGIHVFVDASNVSTRRGHVDLVDAHLPIPDSDRLPRDAEEDTKHLAPDIYPKRTFLLPFLCPHPRARSAGGEKGSRGLDAIVGGHG